ncbi:MAG: prefoldin subunit alpha [Promethearchaeota archaeon Loki_b31]|nr:MAG: prefoldin subunit alpha [Candidatus Lokiarchaeota archaeon Loki_b31]
MENNQNFEKQLQQFRYIKEQRDMFQGQFEIVNASLGNLYTTKKTLDNLKDGVDENDEILIPIGGLVSIKGSIIDTKKVLVSVNQDTVIEKTIEESIEFINKLMKQHNEQLNFLKERILTLDYNLQGINQMLQGKTG